MVCVIGASGSRVSIAITRERVCGIIPAGIATAVTDLDSEASSNGLAVFNRANGSFIDDGFTPGQMVTMAGFAAGANNGEFRAMTVTATALTVLDVAGVVVLETTDVGNTCQIRLERLRTVTKNINVERNQLESGEISPDRMKLAARQGFERVAGAFNLELGLRNFNTIIEAALSGSYEKPETMTPGDITGLVTDTAGRKTMVRATGSWIEDGFRDGDLIAAVSVPGAVNATDIHTGRIAVVVNATNIVVEFDPTGPQMPTGVLGAGTEISYRGYRVDIGQEIYTHYVERQFLDVGQFQPFSGVSFDTLGLNLQPEENVGGTSNMIGMRSLPMAQTSLSALDPIEPTADEPFAAFDGGMFENNIAIALLTSLEMELANNRTLEPVVGQKFSPGIFDGQAAVTGTATVMFQDEVLYNKFYNETETSFQARLDTADGSDSWSLVVPRAKYTAATMDPPQQGYIPLQLPFEALEQQVAVPGGTTRGTVLTIQRTDDVVW